jgi:hypothetical protein
VRFQDETKVEFDVVFEILRCIARRLLLWRQCCAAMHFQFEDPVSSLLNSSCAFRTPYSVSLNLDDHKGIYLAKRIQSHRHL